MDAFQKALRELGYEESKNLLFEYRWAGGDDARLPELANDLVRLNVEVIVVSGTPAILALKKATTTIPIVMAAAGDPVGTGIVNSLAHPSGNITGMSNMIPDVGGKRSSSSNSSHQPQFTSALFGTPITRSPSQ